MFKVVDPRALQARKTILLCEVGVTGSAKSRLFAIRRAIHAAGNIGWGLAFPRRGNRTGGYRVFTDVRGFGVLECLGVWTSDGRAIADRLPRGGAQYPMGAQTAQEHPCGFLISRCFLLSLSFPRER